MHAAEIAMVAAAHAVAQTRRYVVQASRASAEMREARLATQAEVQSTREALQRADVALQAAEQLLGRR